MGILQQEGNVENMNRKQVLSTFLECFITV